jgi:transcriptional regulator with XRE-family HTH domain
MDDLTAESYRPDALLRALARKLKAMTDADIAAALSVAPPVISKIRSKKLPIGPSMLIRMHDITGFEIGNMRELMGLPRRMYIRD